MDEALDSVGYNNCSCCWLKGVRVAFLLEEGLLESSNDCYKRLEADIMAVAAAVGTEVDSIDCHGGKQGGGGMFPAVVALVYIGV